MKRYHVCMEPGGSPLAAKTRPGGQFARKPYLFVKLLPELLNNFEYDARTQRVIGLRQCPKIDG